MIDTVYVEESVAAHPRTRAILRRFAHGRVIPCAHYGEIFNRHNQNFRLQKTRPALILAHKRNRRVLPVPPGYGLDTDSAYYFSHMLNCLYDCRYCYLQGMFRSAHYVLFVNYEDFLDDIRARCADRDEPVWFFSGYDCDSLALEPVTGFAAEFVPALDGIDHAWLELRSKSTQIRGLLQLSPAPRCVCAFSLSPQPIVAAFEHRTPTLAARLDAMARLQTHGWTLGLRFDPLLAVDGARAIYRECFAAVFAQIDGARLHSVTLGAFRLPPAQARRIARLYPDHRLFALAREDRAARVVAAGGGELLEWCHEELAHYVDPQRIFRHAA